MAYDRKKLELMLDRIPQGKVTTHGTLAPYNDTTPRALAKAICSSESIGRIRVLLKGGRFPHPENEYDCLERAAFLRSEGLKISENNRRVIMDEKEMWKP
ncbi:MAG: hypothetical protein Q7U10_00795 [Thermodesulfovibrionia bacterium]|nr:hypothetical protein [Thermodesulfovibrionia bacterium]